MDSINRKNKNKPLTENKSKEEVIIKRSIEKT